MSSAVLQDVVSSTRPPPSSRPSSCCASSVKRPLPDAWSPASTVLMYSISLPISAGRLNGAILGRAASVICSAYRT